jgi:hypothetical protein
MGRVTYYHQLLNFFVSVTIGYCISGTYRLDPAHWALPIVSEYNKTVSAATDLLTSFRQFFPTTAADTQKHMLYIVATTF